MFKCVTRQYCVYVGVISLLHLLRLETNYMILLLTDRTYIRRFFEESRDQGIIEAARQSLRRIRVSTTVHGKIVSKGPLLLIANHPSAFDNLTLWSVMSRKDAFMFSWIMNKKLGSTYHSHTIPVYFSGRPVESVLDLIRVPYWSYAEGLTREEAVKLNRESVRRSAELLDAGHCVIIFPSGSGVDSQKQWKNGVGFLLQQVQNPDVRVQFINISGTRWYDIFRYTPLIRLQRFFLTRRLVIRVSRPWEASFFTDSQDGRKITKKLQMYYHILVK